MEDSTIFDVKKAFFYFFFSWRTLLLCVLVCVLLNVGLAYLPSETPDTGEESTQLDPQAWLEERNKFIATDQDAKTWASQVKTLENEKVSLENELSNSFFLQSDPEHGFIKHFAVRFFYFSRVFEDETDKIRTNLLLCDHYMTYLTSSRYKQYLELNGLFKFNRTDLANLINISVKQDGYLDFTVTGSDEIVIDQVIMLTKNYLRRVIHPEIDPLSTHFLIFDRTTSQEVKLPAVRTYREDMARIIADKEARIETLNQQIDDALAVYLQQRDQPVPVPSNQPSLSKNITFGVLMGLLISFLISTVRYRREIIRTDASAMAREKKLPYIGVIPYAPKSAKQPEKRQGGAVDRFFVRSFSMAYDPKESESRANYIAQVILNALEPMEGAEETLRASTIFVPGAQGDENVGALVARINEALDRSDSRRPVTLIAGGNPESDPDAVDAAKESVGWFLLSKPSDTKTSLRDSVRMSTLLSKPILGVAEVSARW